MVSAGCQRVSNCGQDPVPSRCTDHLASSFCCARTKRPCRAGPLSRSSALHNQDVAPHFINEVVAIYPHLERYGVTRRHWCWPLEACPWRHWGCSSGWDRSPQSPTRLSCTSWPSPRASIYQQTCSPSSLISCASASHLRVLLPSCDRSKTPN